MTLQDFSFDHALWLPTELLGYASDVANDLVPLALAFAGVMMGMRIFRAMKR